MSLWQRLKAWVVREPLEAPPPPPAGRLITQPVMDIEAWRAHRRKRQNAHVATQVNVCQP